MPARKKPVTEKAGRASKVCEKCTAPNRTEAAACTKCGGRRFAPEWIRDLRRVNRAVSVQVTRPQARDGKQDSDRITLYKWWPGGRQNFNIPTQAQWNAIRDIIDRELGPVVGWTITPDLQEVLDAGDQAQSKGQKRVQAAVKADPAFLKSLLKGIDLKKVDPNDYQRIGDALGEVAAVYLNADQGLRRAIQQLVKDLPAQGEGAIRQLSDLMETLTLSQITAVTSEVQRRIGLLKTFKDRIGDERTYEIRGPGSVHRLLEQAMWIVDERYWLMHSNQQLRTVVGDEILKKHKMKADMRPDFVCGTVDNRLIVIEIKRPSHKLSVDDLNQLEEYIVLMSDYQDYSAVEASLVGKGVPDEVKKYLKFRRGVKAISYTQLLGDAERRYADYLKALGDGAEAPPGRGGGRLTKEAPPRGRR